MDFKAYGYWGAWLRFSASDLTQGRFQTVRRSLMGTCGSGALLRCKRPPLDTAEGSLARRNPQWGDDQGNPFR